MNKEDKPQNKILNLAFDAFVLIFLLGIAYTISITFFFKPTTIIGSSMGNRKYADKTFHIVCKVCKDIKRGDVVVYKNNKDPEIDLVGRVIGLPGESIVVENKLITINGKQLQENYADWNGWDYEQKIEFKLADNEYFAFSDKRKTPTDTSPFLDYHKFYFSKYVGEIL